MPTLLTGATAAKLVLILLVARCLAFSAPAGDAIPVNDCDGIPCAEVTAGPQHLRLAIDTGNGQSVIDHAVANNLISAKLGSKVVTVLGNNQMASLLVPTIIAGPHTFLNSRFIIMDLKKFTAEGHAPHVDGTIGYGALMGMLVRLDLPHNRLELQSGGDQVCSASTTSLIPFGPTGPSVLVSNAFSLHGQTMALQIDTFFTGSLLLYSGTRGNEVASPSETDEYPFTDGGIRLKRGPSEMLKVISRADTLTAQVSLAGPSGHNPNGMFQGTVGVALLKKTSVELDLREHCVKKTAAAGR